MKKESHTIHAYLGRIRYDAASPFDQDPRWIDNLALYLHRPDVFVNNNERIGWDFSIKKYRILRPKWFLLHPSMAKDFPTLGPPEAPPVPVDLIIRRK